MKTYTIKVFGRDVVTTDAAKGLRYREQNLRCCATCGNRQLGDDPWHFGCAVLSPEKYHIPFNGICKAYWQEVVK